MSGSGRAAQREGSRKSQDSIVSAVNDVDISVRIHRDTARFRETHGGCGECRREVGLPQDKIGGLPVGEGGCVAEAQHSIVSRVAYVQSRRTGRGIESDTFRQIDLAAFYQIRIEALDLRRILPDDAGGGRVKRDLCENPGQEENRGKNRRKDYFH